MLVGSIQNQWSSRQWMIEAGGGKGGVSYMVCHQSITLTFHRWNRAEVDTTIDALGFDSARYRGLENYEDL